MEDPRVTQDETRLLLELYYLTARLNRNMETIMTTQAELVTKVTALTEQVTKIGLETSNLQDSVAALQEQLAAAGGAGGTITPELQAAVDALAAQVQLVDDLVPDTPAA